MAALANRDLTLAHQVIADDTEVNFLRYDIEPRVFEDHFYPAAYGYRFTQYPGGHSPGGGIRAIGDHAAGIATLVERLQHETDIGNIYKLPKMAKNARDLVQKSVQAYLEHDAEFGPSFVKAGRKN